MLSALKLLVFLPALALAQPKSVFIAELTWPEVKQAIASGKTTAIYYAGSTEQNGPHMALGKHNVIAGYLAGRIAEELGNALAYPVLPFAPTGDHLKFPGSVTLSDQTFATIARAGTQSPASTATRALRRPSWERRSSTSRSRRPWRRSEPWWGNDEQVGSRSNGALGDHALPGGGYRDRRRHGDPSRAGAA